MPKVTVNNITLDYSIRGKGKTLVFLHGLGSTKKDWDFQIPVFSKHYQTINVDLRGHGNSTVPSNKEEYGVPHMANDIKELLIELQITKASLIGFSMGGAVAFELAAMNPNLVDKLVIANSGPDFNDMGQLGEDLLTERTKFIKEKGMKELASLIASNMLPEDHQTKLRNEFEERCAKNSEYAYYHSFVTLMNWGLGDRLTTISHKTLVVASDMDYSSVEFKRKYTSRMRNAKLVVIENSRHGVVLDQPEEFNNIVSKFLSNE